VDRLARVLRRLTSGALLIALALTPAFTPLASDAANAFASIVPALAVIAMVDASGKLSGFGTGFCIGSDDKHSYFVTNHHVVAAPGASVPKLVAILMSDASMRHPARIVVDSKDPDLAIVETDVAYVPVLTFSTTIPQAGDSVAIAGFPWNEGQRWGSLLSGAGFQLANGEHHFPPELEPSYHSGPVSAIHGAGAYYIQYDALTDHGNSGGPLFDPATGQVYGIVQATVPGMKDPLADTPPSVYNNLAISVREGWTVLLKAPIPPRQVASVDRASYIGASRNSLFGPTNSQQGSSASSSGGEFDAHSATHGLSGAPACVAGTAALSQAYGEWAQAHGSLKSLAAVKTAAQANRLYAVHDISAETAAIGKITDAANTIGGARAAHSAALAKQLLAAVSNVLVHDRTYASGVEGGSMTPRATQTWSGGNTSLELPLSDAAARVSALLDCT
jgi:serine protease Do